MASFEHNLREVREAIGQLHLACLETQDDSRRRVAASLEAQFAGVTSRRELRVAARGSLQLYRGGMGSFKDVGSEMMWDAVERLRRALRRASLWW